MTGIPHSLIDDLASELGAIVARIERELRQGFDVLAAELRARAAEMELRAVTAERATADMVLARLASVRDGEEGQPGASVTVEDVAPLIVAEVAKAVAAIPPAKDGKPGESVSMDAVRSMVSDAIAALPPPEPGKDADPVVIEAMVGQAVAKAVAAIPAPRNGLDADPAVIQAMVDDAVAAIPIPKDGKPGADGKLPVAKPWTDGVCYEGDVVTHNGATWQAQRDTGREPPHDDWICLAAAGRNGQDGRSFAIRGTWSAEADYATLDVVALNGATFVARRDAPGECPGDGWQLMSAQGKRGKEGEPGRRGEVGKAGPSLIEATVDDQGLVRLRNADGTVVFLDLYPVLAKIAG